MRVVVVAAVRLYREGLATALDGQRGVEVAGTAAEGAAAVALITATQPAVALVDVGLLLGSDLVPRLIGACGGMRAVALGLRDDAPQILACAELGVSSYVLRDAGVDELVDVLRATERGEVRCSPHVAACLMRRVSELTRSTPPWSPVGDQLTARELQVVALLEQGLMNKEIARRLGLSLSTVKNHVHNVLDKLGLSSRNEAARWHRAMMPDRIVD